MRLVKVATCNLNQWAMDFAGNKTRIISSILRAKEQGAKFRLGPELEISGYGCEDHYNEIDTFTHSWEVLLEILPHTDGILCDIGMPVLHHCVRYNCRVYCVNQKIVLIRPKKFLAGDGNYREGRHFTPWVKEREVEDFVLPPSVQEITGEQTVPFGDGIVQVGGVTIGTETCEELFTTNSPHISLYLAGVDIVGNGSGSHHQLRKLDKRIGLITEATAKGGGVYLYSNQQGCDGGRVYYDGCAMISVNGNVVAQGTQFSLRDVEVVTGVVDLDEIVSYRASVPSRSAQAAQAPLFPRAQVTGFDLLISEADWLHSLPTQPIDVHFHSPEEEIALGPACWLWDYLRRCGMKGFFLPLSGGADSSSTAALVACMCQLVVEQCNRDGVAYLPVLEDVRRITGEKSIPSAAKVPCVGDDAQAALADGGYVPTDPRELAGRIFYTCYMGTSNSSEETKLRAEKLAGEVGSNHRGVVIDSVVGSIKEFFVASTERTPRFLSEGGSDREDLALQNIQARSRMVLSYLFAQLLPWSNDKEGSLLVLGSANVDEALRGYLTKYDCSSADINPIGGISKSDLKQFLRWGANNLGLPSLEDVANATPTAELRPIAPGETLGHTDEDDMGMTYEELKQFGNLRKVERCGPVSMFHRLLQRWSHLSLSPTQIAEKVQRFFRFYSINRHKLTTLTPAYHAENYSPDDNRFDLRQFLYNVRWPWQFQRMDQAAAELETKRKANQVTEPNSQGPTKHKKP